MKNQTINTIGFIGLGVMGNSMCKNLLQNKNWSIMVNDINKNKEEDLHNHGAIIASDIEDLFDKSDVIITCLPGGSFVYEMYFGKQNIISFIKRNKYIVDMSTSQPDLMVKLNVEIKKKNSFFSVTGVKSEPPVKLTCWTTKDLEVVSAAFTVKSKAELISMMALEILLGNPVNGPSGNSLSIGIVSIIGV